MLPFLCRQLSNRFYFRELTVTDDLKMIADNFEFGPARFGNRLEEVLRWLISNGCPGLGLFERKSSKLVSWVLSDIDGQALIGHTLDEYRKLGLQTWVLLETIERNILLSFHAHAVGYIAKAKRQSLEDAPFFDSRSRFDELCANFVVKACDNVAKL